MALFRCQRQVSKCGGSTYIPFPRQAMLDLRLFMGDWVEVILDTDTHTLTVRPLKWRSVAPMPGPKQNTHDMVPDELTAPACPTLLNRNQPQLQEVGE